MKKLLLLLGIAFSATTFAQSTLKDDIDVVQSVYGKSKADLVSQYMALSGDKATDFKKFYDAYEEER